MCQRFELMHPLQAQHTPVIRVPGFLSRKEISEICEVVDRLRAQDAVAFVSKDKTSDIQGDNWGTTYLHTNGHFQQLFPALLQRIREAIFVIDEHHWQILQTRDRNALNFRCIEHHWYGPGADLDKASFHYDTGSLITVDMMLSKPGHDFQGGQFYTPAISEYRPAEPHTFEKGDLMLFVSHKYHQVTPISNGERKVLVMELWDGPERTCAHRCLDPVGSCNYSLGTQMAERLQGIL